MGWTLRFGRPPPPASLVPPPPPRGGGSWRGRWFSPGVSVSMAFWTRRRRVLGALAASMAVTWAFLWLGASLSQAALAMGSASRAAVAGRFDETRLVVEQQFDLVRFAAFDPGDSAISALTPISSLSPMVATSWPGVAGEGDADQRILAATEGVAHRCRDVDAGLVADLVDGGGELHFGSPMSPSTASELLVALQGAFAEAAADDCILGRRRYRNRR